jgi:hypothetical protein
MDAIELVALLRTKHRMEREFKHLTDTYQQATTGVAVHGALQNIIAWNERWRKDVAQNIGRIANKQASVSMFDEVDQMVFKQPWNRLQEFHKNIKLREFFKSKGVTDIDQKIENVRDLLKRKKLKVKDIIYDPQTTVIKSIKGFLFDEEEESQQEDSEEEA